MFDLTSLPADDSADIARWASDVLTAPLHATDRDGLKIRMPPAIQRRVLSASMEATVQLQLNIYRGPLTWSAPETHPTTADELRTKIEALPGVVGVGTSDRALNIFGQPHTQFVNGSSSHEGKTHRAYGGELEYVLEDTFTAVRIYRNSFAGDVFLTWRIYPEISSEGVYLRLSFTPVRDAVALLADAGTRVASETHP